MVAEGATFAEATPTPSVVVLSKKKMQGHMYASRELVQDSAFDIGSLFLERVSAVMAETEDIQIATSAGTGANFTNGLETGSVITENPEASAGVFTFIDLLDLWFGLPEQYQEGAMFFVSSQFANYLSRLTIPSVNWPVLNTQQPIGTVGDGVNTIGTVFGRPVVILPLSAGSIFVGNPKYYGILENPGIEVEASTHHRWATDEVAWKFTRRIDGNVLLGAAFQKTVGITSIA
jgi:HK97 family phage major capsid protein